MARKKTPPEYGESDCYACQPCDYGNKQHAMELSLMYLTAGSPDAKRIRIEIRSNLQDP